MPLNGAVFTISTAAMLLGLHPRTLMLYERAKLIFPYRTSKNRRMFSLKDLEQLQFIKYLTQEKGVNLNGVKAVLEALDTSEKEGLALMPKMYPDYHPKKLI